MRPTAANGNAKWDRRANSADTYAHVSIPCACDCGGNIYRNFDAFIATFAEYVAPEMREAFASAVIDGQERHEIAGDDARGTWTGCARVNRRTQQEVDAPVLNTEITPVLPIPMVDRDALKRDAHRRAMDEKRRGWMR